MKRGGTLLSPRNNVEGDIYGNAAVCVIGRVNEYVNAMQTTVSAQSLSTFTCKFFLLRGGPQFIFGLGIKGQGQL